MSLYDGDKARLLAAYARKKHDRVPNLEISIDPGVLSRIMNWEEEGLVRSDMMPPEKQIEIAKRTYQDAIICNAQFWLTKKEGSISTREELELAAAAPFHLDAIVKNAKDTVNAVSGTNLGVGAMLAGPFFTSYWLMGPIPIQSYMYMLYDDIDFVKEFMAIQTKRQVEIIMALEGVGIDFVEIAEDLCDNSGPLIRLELLEELWYDNMEQIVKAIKNYLKVPIQFHCCGKIDKVVQYFTKLEVDVLTPIQTSVNDIVQLKKDYGKQFSFAGNLSIDGVLAFGTPDEVRKQVKYLIENVGYDGGYVVASSHSVVDAIPAENYFAMIEAAVEYGAY